MPDRLSRPDLPMPPPRRWLAFGLSTKLLALTVLFIMVAEGLVLVPSVANFRINWLRDRLNTADIVALSLSEMNDVSRSVQDKLLAATGAMTIAVRDGNMRRLVAMAEMPPVVGRRIDLADAGPISSIIDAADTIVSGEGRYIHVLGLKTSRGDLIELVIPETPLRAAMLGFAVNILGLSAIISAIAGAFVFFSLRRLFLQPLLSMRQAMETFSARPEDPASIILPSGRLDELGDAERRLAAMQRDLAATLSQKSHLADLGLAVSKLNHDLRNILAAAQLLTERLALATDPSVQRFAPKLLASLDRAIGYSQAVLNYGKAREAPPERRLISVGRLVEDVGDVLGLTGHPVIRFDRAVAEDLEVDADPDQLFRVLMNLCRNAAQALEADLDPSIIRRITVAAGRQGSVVTIRISDTGPGVPPKARDNLFRAFQGGVRSGGTGLGLAICAELVRAHGGSIELIDSGPGARFDITIPDRVIELKRPRRPGQAASGDSQRR